MTIETNLTWTRGDGAKWDLVYFGTDPCDVNLPQVDTIEAIFPAEHDPGDPNLLPSTTYYWYVVEVNSPNEYPGPLWSFSTIPGEAFNPIPADGDVIAGIEYPSGSGHLHTTLDFSAGPTTIVVDADYQTGYFSDDYSKVYNRDQDANLGPLPFPPTTRYYVGLSEIQPYTQSLVRGTTYYWCVDGTDDKGNTFPGDIWEFGIQGYKAFDPSPPNEAIFVEPDVLLEWRAGYGAEQHDVYMSTSWDDVNNAVYDANTPPPEFLTTTMEPNHMVTGLPRGIKKYWRVDEVIGRLSPFPVTIYKGDVWEFTTQIFTSEYRDKGYRYLSPVPMAEYVRPETRYILVRFEEVSPDDITNLLTFIDVTGEASGTHAGQTKIATDDRTVIFEVLSGFSNDELVTVTLTPTVDPCAPGVVVPYQYQFMVTGPMPAPPPPLPSSVLTTDEQFMNRQAKAEMECKALPATDMSMTAEDRISVTALEESMIMSNGVSVPSDFPQVVITVNNNPSPGYLFFEHAGFTMMLDNNGEPVWYRRGGGRDFKIQKNGMITWTQFNGVDENFNNPRSYRAVNGYNTDSHELQIQEDGGYLLLGVRGMTVDMTLYDPSANPNANVNETVIQEFTADDELIFQWRAWDYFDPLDCEPHLANPLGGSFNFTHMNAVDIDEDGHILLSSRHISEVTKINRDTGEIIWRLCGTEPSRSDFVFVNDPLNGFSNLHDIRSMGNGRYTIFDNGNLHTPQVSRGVEYELDLDNGTATMVWEYRDGKYTHYMGNAQRLPTGNTLINFVRSSFPTLVEVDPNGVKQFEIDLIPGGDLYRGFRFPWNGIVDKPYLEIENQPDNITLIFNKFGDPNVDYYRIYGGTTPQPTTVIATSTSTLKRLFEGFENGLRYYFRVTAVDIHGTESDYSNEESAVISFTEPGQIVVLNGDFCQEQASWIWEIGGSANAAWQIEGGVSHFDITNGGTQISDVQLRQAGMKLVRGKEYIFEFDAWSVMPRIIEAKVGQDESPWTNYSKIGYS
ncbi:MAG: aryl-sulfate sulfotransferase, partial [Planctomycetota bacterium]